jgi:Predicted hydrolases or acyltransferases (alpha/beta hydrolase superfamily)
MADLFSGFETRRIRGDGVDIHLRIGGAGAPLVLLHGYPQTHATWHRVAPELARHFTVVVPDLRGYGDSEAPADDQAHTVYSKRAMAKDIAAVMTGLGFDRFSVLGHDRGARVAYRLGLDLPDRVERLGIIEVVPTGEMWRAFNADMALGTYHWPFLAQPAPLPERLIGSDPDFYLEWTLKSWTKAKSLDAFDPEALAAYRIAFRQEARVAAVCADYRAGATTDRALDEADLAAGRRISAPLHFLWADGGFPSRTGDPLGLWRKWATDVTGSQVVSGHFAQEENPEGVLSAFVPFFEGASG